jgi:hypothetical protein
MSRRDIYYWKCDRPAAFHGTQSRGEMDANLAAQLEKELQRHFDTKNVILSPGAGQGNHLTWNAEVDGEPLFVRVENGPEKDAHLAVESALLDRVRQVGVATPLLATGVHELMAVATVSTPNGNSRVASQSLGPVVLAGP